MKYWLISDTHFNHSKLEEWGDRSGDWQERLWSGIMGIPTGDTLIHLGDICIGNDQEIMMKLNRVRPFRLILVRGNHDKKSLSWYMDHGFHFVCDGLDLLYNGYYLKLTHRPEDPALSGKNNYNIHGHTHGNMHRAEEYISWYDKSYHIDISPELVGFGPILLDTLLEKHARDKRRKERADKAEPVQDVSHGSGAPEHHADQNQ